MSQFYLTALQMALCLAPMAMGIFISMNVFNIPDITTDGSYTLGASLTAVMVSAQIHPLLVLPCSMLAGSIAGACTGFIHTKLKIEALLSGILVMTALYSVNLLVMGRSNIPLINTSSVFTQLRLFANERLNQFILALLVASLFMGAIVYLLKTDFGIAMRASVNNPAMTRALGVNNDRIKIIGLALANALTALSGFLVAQYQGFADINMGIGIVITGLGSVLIGSTLKKWLCVKSIGGRLLLVLAGCFVFQLVLALTLSSGVNPNLLKMVTAAFVLLIVALPGLSGSLLKKQSES